MIIHGKFLYNYISKLPRKEQCRWEKAIREKEGYYVDQEQYPLYDPVVSRDWFEAGWIKIKRIWQKIIKVL